MQLGLGWGRRACTRQQCLIRSRILTSQYALYDLVDADSVEGYRHFVLRLLAREMDHREVWGTRAEA